MPLRPFTEAERVDLDLHADDGDVVYEDAHVWAQCQWSGGTGATLLVHDFRVKDDAAKRRGHGREALRRLRPEAQTVVANGVESGSDAMAFWDRMGRERLIDLVQGYSEDRHYPK